MDRTTDLRRALTEKEAADILGLTPKALQKWRWQGKGPVFCKVGRLVRYLPGDIDAFLESCKVQGA